MELFGLRFQFAPYFVLDPYVKLTCEPFCIDSSVDGIGWIFGQLEMSGCREKRVRKEKRGVAKISMERSKEVDVIESMELFSLCFVFAAAIIDHDDNQ